MARGALHTNVTKVTSVWLARCQDVCLDVLGKDPPSLSHYYLCHIAHLCPKTKPYTSYLCYKLYV